MSKAAVVLACLLCSLACTYGKVTDAQVLRDDRTIILIATPFGWVLICR